MDALEFRAKRRQATAHAITVWNSLDALSGDGSYIHEAKGRMGLILGASQIMDRAAKLACKDWEGEWTDWEQAKVAIEFLERLVNHCDAAVGWMVRIARE